MAHSQRPDIRKVNTDPPPNNTPYGIKLSTQPHSAAPLEFNVEAMKDKIDRELEGHKSQNRDLLIEHIFPDTVLPAPVDDIYKGLATGKDRLYFPRAKRWFKCPQLTRESDNGDQEEALARFLMKVTKRIAKIVDQPCDRIATGAYASNKTHLPGGPGFKRRPDVLIFDSGEERQAWETVISHWELKNNAKPKNKRDAGRCVAEGVRLIYESQYGRRFVPSLSILGYEIILHIIDRAGEVSSKPFDINAHPRVFLRILTAFMFASKEYLGYDATITTMTDGRRCVTVAKKEYEIEEWVYHSHSIRGRGTSCWRATRDGTTYAIKDYWTDVTRATTEAEFLKAARGVEGVCHLVDEEIVASQGQNDSTDRVRPASAKRSRDPSLHAECRMHRRLVLEPYAIPITFFETKKELIGAFIDTIKAHKALLEEAEILHRDISVNNIMLIAARDANGRRRGLLIDLDYAMRYSKGGVSTGQERKVGQAERTGTMPFMALALLSSDGTLTHQPEWDLESWFYVLVWICILYDGPKNSERKILFSETLLKGWTYGTFKEVSRNKGGCVEGKTNWPHTLAEFAPYFEDLKPCLSKWRKVLFVDDDPTHDAVVAVLEETYRSLPDQELPLTVRDFRSRADLQMSAVQQYRTGTYLEDKEDAAVLGAEEDEAGREEHVEPLGHPASRDDEGSSQIPLSGPTTPVRSRTEVASNGAPRRKRTHKESEEGHDSYTEHGIYPSSREGGRRDFTNLSFPPSPLFSNTSLGTQEELSPSVTKVQRRQSSSSKTQFGSQRDLGPSKRLRSTGSDS